MNDPPVRVPALAGEGQLRDAVLVGDAVEVGPVFHQLLDPLRGLADDQLDHVRVAQPLPGGDRVGGVAGEVVGRVEDPGNPALGVGAVRLPKFVFRDDDGFERRIDRLRGERGPDAGDARPQHQHVGEHVRHPFRVEPHEVPRRVEAEVGERHAESR